MNKINNKGDFLEFPGVTVISLIKPEDSFLWKKLFQFLSISPIIQKYYSLLPYSSYHMTVNNLYSKDNNTMLEWSNFISKHLVFFQTLDHYLQETSLNPQITILDNVVTEWVLQLNFSLPPSQVLAVSNLAKYFKLENKLPLTFHMTLAYQKPNLKLSFEEHKELKNYVLAVLNEVKKIFSNITLELLPPQLCYFKDMTKFVPWNGKSNPFETVRHAQLIEDNENKIKFFDSKRVDVESSNLVEGISLAALPHRLFKL